MSISYSVIGHFSNGQRRTAGLHWPGGSNMQEFENRKATYAKVFKSELQDAPVRNTGFPKFEYITIEYRIMPTNSNVTPKRSALYLALTPGALAKLQKSAGGVAVAQGSNNLSGKVIDMTKITTPKGFWTSVRSYSDRMFKQAFAVLQ